MRFTTASSIGRTPFREHILLKAYVGLFMLAWLWTFIGTTNRANWFTGNASSVSTYVVDADEAKYEAAMNELLGFHSQLFIAYLTEKSK